MEPIDTRLDREAEQQLKAVWWVFLVIGVLTAGLGVVVIFHPLSGAYGLAILIAITLIVSGIGDLIGAAQWRHSWVPLLWGVLAIVAGIVALAWPGIALSALAVLIGVVLIVRGTLRALASLSGRPPVWGLMLCVGLLELAAGVVSLVWPEVTILVLALVIGIDLVIVGIVAIASAIRLRRLIV